MNATIQETVDWLSTIDSDEIWEVIDHCGCSRIVWLCDDIAYKFLRSNPMHANNNATEWNLYNEVSDEVRGMMAECLAISENGEVLAMCAMSCVIRDSDSHSQDDRRRFNKALCQALERSGIEEEQAKLLTNDNHSENIGVDASGELRWIDYGSNRSTIC